LWLLLFLDANVVLLLPEQNTSKSAKPYGAFLVMNTGITGTTNECIIQEELQYLINATLNFKVGQWDK
jgi:hypothetical protein